MKLYRCSRQVYYEKTFQTEVVRFNLLYNWKIFSIIQPVPFKRDRSKLCFWCETSIGARKTDFSRGDDIWYIYRVFLNNMLIFKMVILGPILRKKLHMNVCPKRLNFWDIGCWSVKKKINFLLSFSYHFKYFYEIWCTAFMH